MRKVNLQFFVSAALMLSAASMIFLTSCGKDGIDGKDGANGANGTNGTNGTNGDAVATCKLCHNPSKVDSMATTFQFSKHEYGEAAFEEAGNTGCTPCHAQEAFKYMCKNNVSAAFAKLGTDTTYTNLYSTSASAAYGRIGCYTCHSSLHTTYGYSDMTSLTTTAPVAMTFFGGTKSINLTQDGGKSNLCVKCHQPRPFTKSNTGQDKNVLDYALLKSNPTDTFYSPYRANSLNVLKPSYRTHTHYGTVGAVYAGVGFAGIEYGTGYTNSPHTTLASCGDCHMAPMTGKAGSHSFVAKGNFNGCNVSGCHATAPISATSTTKWTTPRAAVKLLLDQLAAKLRINGVDILNRNGNTNEAVGGVNLWAGLTTNNYDGYLNIYDPVTNPLMDTYNTTSFQFIGTPSASTWTAAQIAKNAGLPKLALTNAQMGAIINFQMCLREYSLGIHNTEYVKTLLTNTISILP
ncbi:MAG: ammonia-forming cytochrome c nitrite reductase subunit c552 [Bacteroidales bacterium]